MRVCQASFTALLFTCVVASAGALHAQGLPNARTDVRLLGGHAATTDNGNALLVNPAGLAFVDGIEFNAGLFTSVQPNTGWRMDGDGSTTFGLGGLSMALGAGVVAPLPSDDSKSPLGRLSAAGAVRLDDGLAIGATVHQLAALTNNGRQQLAFDLGVQSRPSRWVAIGAVLEGIGNGTLQPPTGRGGLAVRPLGDWLTLGLEARVKPGAAPFATEAYFATSSIQPALSAVVAGTGWSVGAGVDVRGLSLASSEPVAAGVFVAAGIDVEQLGVAFVGGVPAIGDGIGAAGGVRGRASTATWTSIFSAIPHVVELTLGGEGVVPAAPANPIEQFFASDASAVDVLAKLDDIARDDRVRGLLLRLQGLSFGWGRAAELRAALVRIRESGKPVYVHLDSGDDLDVYVASAADEVWLSPAGGLALDGVRATLMYAAEALSWAGVEAEAVAAGKYKSAPRTFTHSGPSDEELEVQNAILDGVFATMTSAIAEGRGIDADVLLTLIDKGGLTGPEAVAGKIVDALVYDDELKESVERAMGSTVIIDDEPFDVGRSRSWGAAPEIALIPVVGTINMGHARPGLGDVLSGPGVGAADFVEAIDEALEDDAIRAIVVRIDSPGGDALASDLMWRAVMRARTRKPTVVSMGDYAASGGYYIASAGQHVFAEPDTLTGSIGVFSLMFNAEALADRFGIRSVELSRGERPGPTLLRGTTDSERERMQHMVDDTYARFLAAIVEGRGSERLSIEKAREIGEGRVWTGLQARDRGLVDELGGLREAISWAKDQAGIDADEPIALRAITSGSGVGRLTQLGAMMGMGMGGAQTANDVGRVVRMVLGRDDALWLVDQQGRPMAMPATRLIVR
jgi:protease IV